MRKKKALQTLRLGSMAAACYLQGPGVCSVLLCATLCCCPLTRLDTCGLLKPVTRAIDRLAAAVELFSASAKAPADDEELCIVKRRGEQTRGQRGLDENC